MNDTKYTGFEIAVIGISCRLPGANNINDFWANLIEGKESITYFNEEQLKEAGYSEDVIKDPNFVGATGGIDNSLCFDHSFFGYTPKEAQVMDPQVRMLHECVWHALEDSGYNPEGYKKRIGFYCGAAPNVLWEANSELTGKNEEVGTRQAKYFNNKDFLAGLISYKLNLKGPAVSFYTACSTSLVAIHLASQSLINGECEMALAGGVTHNGQTIAGYLSEEDLHYSTDGHNRAFDKDATGTVPSRGVGIVVLKRLDDAIRDRDYIYGIIKGSAINNDGNQKVGFMAPSVEGQSNAIRSALRMSNVHPNEITYVETHGTATKIGDPIEVASLTKAFNTSKRNYCALGTVKSNIGHTDCAAGVAGFIKTILALKNKIIPPSLHFKEPNPNIDFKESPFYVNNKLISWSNNSNHPLYAGISSFGIGGTNAHAVLSEPPEIIKNNETPMKQLMIISAKTKSALKNISGNLVDFLENNPDTNITDFAYSMNIGRKLFEFKKTLVAEDIDELIKELSSPDIESVNHSHINNIIKKDVIFVFSGQGSQFINTGKELYSIDNFFRQEVDKCCSIVNAVMGIDFVKILFPTLANQKAKDDINNIHYSGLAKFTIEYAMSKLLISYGIMPDAMIGHSFGELAVATIAGVFSLEDAIKMVIVRGAAMEKSPEGVMTSVPLSVEEIRPLLTQNLYIAAINSSNLTIVSGKVDEVEMFEQKIIDKGYECLRINFQRASHSRLMEKSADLFKNEVAKIKLNEPQIPYISGLTGQWIKKTEATDPSYWAAHLVNTIQFSSGINELLRYKNPVFIQVGCDKGLPLIIGQHLSSNSPIQNFNMLKHDKERISDYEYFLKQLGRICLSGIKIDWNKYYTDKKNFRIPLPGYPFDKVKFSYDINELNTINLSSKGKQSDISNWYYIPAWRKSNIFIEPDEYSKCWLVIKDKLGIGNKFIKELKKLGKTVIEIESGGTFKNHSNTQFTIDLTNENDFQRVVEAVFENHIPDKILHLCSLNSRKTLTYDFQNIDQDLSIGYNSLIMLAKALNYQTIKKEIEICVLSNNVFEIIGKDAYNPINSTMLGPIKVIPIEQKNILCRTIDIDIDEYCNNENIDDLLHEVMRDTEDIVTGLRNNHRWVQCFESIKLDKNRENNSINLKKGGVYLITGGLGGIGFVLSKMLLDEFEAKLMLVGITELSQGIDTYTDTNSKDVARIDNRINRYRELKGLKGEVQYWSIDVSDSDEMFKLQEYLIQEFGEVNGIIHLAGNPDGKMIQLRSAKDEVKVFSSKIKGTLIIDEISKELNPDFIVYGSSRNSIIPAFAHVGHTAASNFLDSYSQYMNCIEGNKRRLSINWNAWREIGQAKEAAEIYSYKTTVPFFERELKHIIFEKHFVINDMDFLSGIINQNNWIVKEHKIAGFYSLPGTAYLDLARMANEVIVGSKAISLSDVYFVQPFTINKGEKRELRVLLNYEDNYCEFSIVSKSVTNIGEWIEHAIGRIHNEELSTIETCNIDYICQKLTEDGKKVDKQQLKGNDLKVFGERWSSDIHVVRYENEVVKKLALPDKYKNDLKDYKLHPGLLDCAIATSEKESFYLPFAYRKVKVVKPLEASIITHIKNINEVVHNKGSISSDLSIYNSKGELLVEIEGYSKIKISTDSNVPLIDGVKRNHLNSSLLQKLIQFEKSLDEDKEEKVTEKESSTNSEGVEIFKRILQVNNYFSQIIVSKSDLSKYLKKSFYKSNKNEELLDEEREFKTLLIPRPTLSSEYKSPGNDIQRTIEKIIVNYLGYEKVGILDDFFELGGDSLKAIFILNRIFKEFSIRIPVIDFFKAPTIKDLSMKIELLQNSNYGAIDNSDIEEIII